MKYDSIVIGAGAAGMTAALNILRNGKSVLIIEKEQIGGQIASCPKVENFPSIKETSGVAFSTNLFNQVMALGAEFTLEEVLKVEKIDDETFIVTTDYGKYESKTVIIATGASHNKINKPGEDLKGVSYCALCDGPFYKGEDVAVIGDANTALQYAILLSGYAKMVHFCMLFDKFFGDKILVDRLLNIPNVKIYKNISLEEMKGDKELSSLHFINTKTNEPFDLDVKACFIAIGESPKTEIFKDLVDRDRNYILTNENMETKTKGLYTIGDVRSKQVRQLTTACSDAAIAAFNISKNLS